MFLSLFFSICVCKDDFSIKIIDDWQKRTYNIFRHLRWNLNNMSQCSKFVPAIPAFYKLKGLILNLNETQLELKKLLQQNSFLIPPILFFNFFWNWARDEEKRQAILKMLTHTVHNNNYVQMIMLLANSGFLINFTRWLKRDNFTTVWWAATCHKGFQSNINIFHQK